jgi:branched-chain amino acid transport system substrate-binding protein
MKLHRRNLLVAGTGVLAAAMAGHRVRAQANTIKIGLLTDFSGPYRDINGPVSVACAKQAISEFTASNPSINIELITADHQNKTDAGTTILRGWFDREGVDMALNLTNSAVALACSTIVTEKDKVCVNTSAGTSVLTGSNCTPNVIHWTYDTWNLAHSTATQVVKAGGDKWFFVTRTMPMARPCRQTRPSSWKRPAGR